MTFLPCLPAHAGSPGPVITNGQLSDSSVPAEGGTLTVTVTVTDTAADISSVSADIYTVDGQAGRQHGPFE